MAASEFALLAKFLMLTKICATSEIFDMSFFFAWPSVESIAQTQPQNQQIILQDFAGHVVQRSSVHAPLCTCYYGADKIFEFHAPSQPRVEVTCVHANVPHHVDFGDYVIIEAKVPHGKLSKPVIMDKKAIAVI